MSLTCTMALSGSSQALSPCKNATSLSPLIFASRHCQYAIAHPIAIPARPITHPAIPIQVPASNGYPFQFVIGWRAASRASMLFDAETPRAPDA
jgi:hypothetical protein